MEIVFFVHARFFDSQSMPRFAMMLEKGMTARGHQVVTWAPEPKFFRLPVPEKLKKWMGYIDQYLVFPRQIKKRIRNGKKETLYVFTDNALGPWVPLVAKHPHVIHCHDFLAQRSGLGEIPENRISWTGRQYQQFIRRGYSKGENFISVSLKTREDLHRFLNRIPARSEMVYNGLNRSFEPRPLIETRTLLTNTFNKDLSGGFLLHVGGNLWYKNRLGVIEIYNAWRAMSGIAIPLLLIGDAPCETLVAAHAFSPYKMDILFKSGIADDIVKLAYAGASVFLFPSIAEGFGWPIAEAMASGCPVITTNEAPMSEVAGNAGFEIMRRPLKDEDAIVWAQESAKVVEQVLTLSSADRNNVIQKGLMNVGRFDAALALDNIEKIYLNILQFPK